ncbi:ArnT family glycosyltransferase [Promineifilum sp.]|uniref:ArnT family glycosyltransferase n=1 Tax=Promineifilum sp. TaxID=2664178 RepID=UPI0035B2CE1A
MTSADRSQLSPRRVEWRAGQARWLLLATLTLLIAALFRMVALDEVPPGLHQDEVLAADIALFVRNGENALFFHHGYGQESLYAYLAAPFGALYGDNLLAARLPSVYLGLLLVAITMRWARRDYGATAALVAGLGLAVSWWPVIFSRIGIRPILEPVLLVAAVWFWPLRDRALGRRGLMSAALAGMLFGLSLYSYTAARVVPAIPALLLLYFGLRYVLGVMGDRSRQPAGSAFLRGQIVYASLILVVALLVYLPLGLTLRANPELEQRLQQLEGPLTVLRAGDPGPALDMTAATLGVFSFTGDPRWTYSLPDRALFDPLTSLLFYGGLLIALWRWRRPVYALLPIWLAVALLPSALSPDAPSTVRLVGALPVVYLLPGLVVAALWQRARARWPNSRPRWAVLGGTLVLLLGLNAYGTARDGFYRWPRELEVRLRYQAAIRDIGRYWKETDGETAPVVADSFFDPIDADTLRRGLGMDVRARWVQTGAEVPGAVVWPAGVVSPRLYVPEYAPLAAELAAAAGVADEPIYRSTAAPSFTVYVLPPEPAATLQPLDADFGDAVGVALSLRGVAMAGEPEPAPAALPLQLITWWYVDAEDSAESLEGELAIFVHLLDESGALVSQADGLDAAAATLWPGDRFLQRHLLPLPALAPGRYELRLGLYRRDEGQRLLLPDGADSLLLSLCEADEVGQLACELPKSP